MNASLSRHKRTPTVDLTPLNATLMELVVNKELTGILKPLVATFTKYQGGAL